MTNICHSDCVEIWFSTNHFSSDRITLSNHSSSKVSQNLQASILDCLFTAERNWIVEARMISISSYAVFFIRSRNPNLVLQRRCVLLYDRFHEKKLRLSVTLSEYPGEPEGCFEWDLSQVLSLFAALKKVVLQKTLCGVLRWYWVSYERRTAETFSPSQSFLVMKRRCSSLKVEFAQPAIFCNLNTFLLKLTNMVD